jgi:hypothetical protein
MSPLALNKGYHSNGSASAVLPISLAATDTAAAKSASVSPVARHGRSRPLLHRSNGDDDPEAAGRAVPKQEAAARKRNSDPTGAPANKARRRKETKSQQAHIEQLEQRRAQARQRTREYNERQAKLLGDAQTPAEVKASVAERRAQRIEYGRAYARDIRKHNTLRMAMQAFRSRPRWLGAFRELVTRSNDYGAALAAVKEHQKAAAAAAPAGGRKGDVPAELRARLDEARWAMAARVRAARIISRLVGSGAAARLAEAATTGQAGQEGTSNLATLEADSELQRWARDMDDIALEVEQRLPQNRESMPGMSLEKLGEEVLAGEEARLRRAVGPRPVAVGGSELLPSMSWAQAAEVLAAEATLMEHSTGGTWLLEGASQGEV